MGRRHAAGRSGNHEAGRARVLEVAAALPVDAKGDTIGGNCDLCYLKGKAKKIALVRQQPSSIGWWLLQEDRTGATFRPHGDTYQRLHLTAFADDGGRVCEIDDDLGDCFCHD